jgi:hypothetical protein
MTTNRVHPMHLVVGLVVWGAWFVAIYGGLSVGCAVAPPADDSTPLNWINISLLLLTAVVVVALSLAARRCWRVAPAAGAGKSEQRFTARVSAALYALSAAATLAVAAPILVLPPCI